MLTYQVRPRVFRHPPGTTFAWPAECSIKFYLKPEQPFGASAEGGRTAVRAQAASLLFNANSGQHFITSKGPLTPLNVRINYPDRVVHLSGTTLEVKQQVKDADELTDLVQGLFFALPPLFNVSFADPPTVERIDGDIGGVPFRWELADWKAEIALTTQDEQEKAAAKALERVSLISGIGGRRLLAALHYFHVAVRLDRASVTVGEFMAEAILNMAKCLEVLFPPSGDGRTRDAVRRGLAALGYTDAEMETRFLPSMALRSEMDVGHVSLSLLTRPQLRAIHAYTAAAERGFREMLEQLLLALCADQLQLAPYGNGEPSAGARKVIERLEAAFPAQQDNPVPGRRAEL